MLPFFPFPYPEETLYSIIARYHMYSGNLCFKYTIRDLYGNSFKRIDSDFITGIGSILSRLPQMNITREDIIYNHTTFPYFSAFIPKDRVKVIAQRLISAEGNEIHKIMGLNASSITNYRHLKHCFKCVDEDIRRYGETYWHRVHQLPGVLVCPTHKLPLETFDKQLYEFSQNEFLLASKDLFDSSVHRDFSQDTSDFLINIAQESFWLLNNKKIMPDFNFYKDKYISILQKMNIASINGRVDQKRLLDLFKRYYPKELLNLIESDVKEQEVNWLQTIVRKHRKVFHPLRHLLLINLISSDIETFYSSNHKFLPFGAGPWPCLNPVHNHYRKNVVNDLRVSICSDTKRPVGTFTCNCGYSYSRRGPDTEKGDIYRRGRIVDFGPLWKKELKRLSTENLSIREMGRRLGVDSKTVKSQQDLMKKGNKTKEDKSYSKKCYLSNQITTKRKVWESLLESYPDRSLKELRMINNNLFTWLFKNDHQWLKDHSPLKRHPTILQSKVDWAERDEKLFREVNRLVKNWGLAEQERPKRITKTSIAKKTLRPHLIIRNGDRLPKTLQLINSSVETIEQFQIRRLEWAYNELINEQQAITKWLLLRKAGIRSDLITERLEQYALKLSQ